MPSNISKVLMSVPFPVVSRDVLPIETSSGASIVQSINFNLASSFDNGIVDMRMTSMSALSRRSQSNEQAVRDVTPLLLAFNVKKEMNMTNKCAPS